MPTPLLILSDAPTSGSGLGRITCDLATRIHKYLPDVFRVGTLGYAGPMSRKLGFPQYTMEMKDWVVTNLPEVWGDFAGDEHGVIFTIWDASRLLWFSRPENCDRPELRHWLQKADFERWAYFPMDATGPHDRLTAILSHTMDNYDRVLAYSMWACDILKRSLKEEELDLEWRPHGIDTAAFYPRNRIVARHGFGERIGWRTPKGKFGAIPDDALMIGIVATNQIRKDYGLGVQTVHELSKKRKVFLWCHVDVLERHWSLPALFNDFKLPQDAVVTQEMMTDEKMAWCYSACDVTLGIGAAEGFGFPIFESLACGTPCIHGNDGGAPEHMPTDMLVQAAARRLEGPYNSYRNVYRPEEWAYRVQQVVEKYPSGIKKRSLLPEHLDWGGPTLWNSWQDWLLKGVRNARQPSAGVVEVGGPVMEKR